MAEDSRTGASMAASAIRSPAGHFSPEQARRLVRQRLESLPAPLRLSPAGAAHLARGACRRAYAAGEIIVPRGARADSLGLVVLGRAVVGSRVLPAGSSFGEEMLARAVPNPATVRALTDCEIWFVQRADVVAEAARRCARRRAGVAARLLPWALLLAALVAAVSLPAARRTLAVLPMGLGEWCREQEVGRCAAQAWRLAARLAPGDVNPLLALGTLHFEQGNVAAAERAFDAALALAPDSPEAHNNLGLVYARQGRHDRAIAAFQRALDLEPGNAGVERNLAASLQAVHLRDEALAHYEQALALGDSHGATFINMAILYYEMGRPEQAGEMAARAAAQDPGLAAAHTVLGMVALTTGRPEAAVLELDRAISAGAGEETAYFYLGLTYQALGRPADARAAYEQALAAAGDEATRVSIRRQIAGLAPAGGGTN